jgi:hypothetical protein
MHCQPTVVDARSSPASSTSHRRESGSRMPRPIRLHPARSTHTSMRVSTASDLLLDSLYGPGAARRPSSPSQSAPLLETGSAAVLDTECAPGMTQCSIPRPPRLFLEHELHHMPYRGTSPHVGPLHFHQSTSLHRATAAPFDLISQPFPRRVQSKVFS